MRVPRVAGRNVTDRRLVRIGRIARARIRRIDRASVVEQLLDGALRRAASQQQNAREQRCQTYSRQVISYSHGLLVGSTGAAVAGICGSYQGSRSRAFAM